MSPRGARAQGVRGRTRPRRRLIGDRHRLIRLDDLAAVAEPIAALLLVAQTEWARGRGAAAHLDGARLWEAQPCYDRPHAEIAALFDSVYVSLYKGLMGTSGAVLAGEEQFVEHAKVWRDRLGGNMARSWPVALAADRGLDELLPRMPEFLARARCIAGLLEPVRGVHVVPDPPQTPLFHVHVDAAAQAVEAVAAELLAEYGIFTLIDVRTAASPRTCGFELSVSEQFDDFTDEEVVGYVAELVKRAAER